MEKLNNTPLPFAYVALLRGFLMLYLALQAAVVAAHWDWGAPLAMGILSFSLLGIEAAAVERERPFRRERNHLALGRFATVAAECIAQTLRDFEGARERATIRTRLSRLGREAADADGASCRSPEGSDGGTSTPWSAHSSAGLFAGKKGSAWPRAAAADEANGFDSRGAPTGMGKRV